MLSVLPLLNLGSYLLVEGFFDVCSWLHNSIKDEYFLLNNRMLWMVLRYSRDRFADSGKSSTRLSLIGKMSFAPLIMVE